MNLFLPAPSIQTSVETLDDKRLVKMCLETAQILSSAYRINNPDTTLPLYKLTHKNHPIVKWTAKTQDNFYFVCDYFYAICQEYKYRFNKTHTCETKLMQYFKISMRQHKRVDPFVNCTIYLDEPNVHNAYKKHLITKWSEDKRAPKWTNRNKPAIYAFVVRND